MKYAREIKVGVLAVVCIFLLFFGFNFLKGVNIFSSMYAFNGVFDNVHGLEEQAPVMIRGYKVGQVNSIKYDFARDSAFTVEISVNRDINLPRGTKMALVMDGLLGGMAIELQLPAVSGQDLCKSGEILPTVYVPGLLEDLQVNVLASLGNAVEGIDSLVAQLNTQLDNDHLANTLSNVDNISSDLKTVSRDLKGLMAHKVSQIVDNADSTINSIKQIASDINGADIAATVARVDSAVAQVNTTLADVNSDNGTLGLLLHDKSLYRNIDATVVSADSLLTDLKANPKRYVHFSIFGQKDKKDKKK